MAWILVTTLLTGWMLMNHDTAAQPAARTTTSGLTCNLDGIPPQKRARYVQLAESLRHAIQERRELPDGYAFRVDTAQMGAGSLVEWVELEQRCCPFFAFEVRWDPENGPMWLHLRGPEGVKAFILEEFGVR